MHALCRAKGLLLLGMLGGCGLWTGAQHQGLPAPQASPGGAHVQRPVLRPGSGAGDPGGGQDAGLGDGQQAGLDSAAPRPVSSGFLGVTTVSLGAATETGLWVKTPMIDTAAMGLARYRGRSIELRLLPIDGAASAGSRLSLQAMLALGLELTDLAEIEIFVY